MNSIITLSEYVGKGKAFVIPEYQRGYIWGKNRIDGKNAVEYLMDDLILHFQNGTDVFLQGFTVNEGEKEIVLIDGQQRTTFLYFLLKKLGYKETLKLEYKIRDKSNEFLANESEWLSKCVYEDSREEFQDVYFFKKTIRIIGEKTDQIDRQLFLSYLLSHVKFLYISINLKEATKIFKLMNGSKADMKQEEIIKAEILRLVSLSDTKFDLAREWESNQLRSRYAREWDKWLHWWNKRDVQYVFGCSNPMGLLISSFANLDGKENLTFKGFQERFLSEGRSSDAKRTFDELRRLQKRFEDAFNMPEIRNRIGAIMNVSSWENREKFIRYFFVKGKRDQDELRKYYKAVFIGMTHDEFINKSKISFESKYDLALQSINDDFLYYNNQEFAFRLLLRLNIDQDIAQGRFFNFDIWKARSLEHIYPKSKVGHSENGEWFDGNNCPFKKRDQKYVQSDFKLTRDQIEIKVGQQTIKATEHGIGNLVLLYKNENSKFNDSDFETKKVLFFSPNSSELVKSRHLLHTICVFAEKEHWDAVAIAENKYNSVVKFEKDYSELKIYFEYEKQN